MKKLLKCFFGITIIFILLNISVHAVENELTVIKNQNNYIVKFNNNSAIENQNITFITFYPNTNQQEIKPSDIKDIRIIKTNSQGICEFELFMDKMDKVGLYSVLAKIDSQRYLATKSFDYQNIFFLEELNNTKNVDDMIIKINELKNIYNSVNEDITVFDLIKTGKQSIAQSLIEKQPYNSLLDFSNAFKEYVSLEALYLSDTSKTEQEEMSTLWVINKYKDYFGVYLYDNPNIAQDEVTDFERLSGSARSMALQFLKSSKINNKNNVIQILDNSILLSFFKNTNSVLAIDYEKLNVAKALLIPSLLKNNIPDMYLATNNVLINIKNVNSIADIVFYYNKAITDYNANINIPQKETGSGGFSFKTNLLTDTKQPISSQILEDNVDNSLPFTGEFVDIEDALWAKEAIYELAKRDIIKGVGENKFSPNDKITKEQLAKMVSKAIGIELQAENEFSDVVKGSWYDKYVQTVFKAEIMLGSNKTYFGVGAYVTRQDLAVVLNRVLKFSGINENPTTITFNDSSLISDYAVEAVSVLSNKKVLNGMGDNNFNPLGFATRAQVAKVLYEIMKIASLE